MDISIRNNYNLDLNFHELYFSDFDINRVEVLEEFLVSNMGVNKLQIAYALYICEKNKLYVQAYPGSRLGEVYLKKMYFNERIPELCSLKKQTISDYRIAGKFIDDHKKRLFQYHKDFFKYDLLKKILMAASAIKNGFSDIDDLIWNLRGMTKRELELYIKGQEVEQSAQPKSLLERYIEVYERQRIFFRL
jgi:hypothetical protein